MLGFPLPRNWFAHDPMRRNSVAFGTILGSGIGFLSAATTVWVQTCDFQSHHQNTLARERTDWEDGMAEKWREKTFPSQ